MPNKKSAKKRVRQNERKQVRNKAAKASMKSHIKSTVTAAAGNDASAPEKQRETQALIARLWKRGVIHKNKASRLQSRLARGTARAKANNG